MDVEPSGSDSPTSADSRASTSTTPSRPPNSIDNVRDISNIAVNPTVVSSPSNAQEPDVRYSPRKIIQISLLLRTLVPADIVPLILDFAKLWGTIAMTSSVYPITVREEDSGTLEAALIIPADVGRRSIRRIRFDILSKDQGWSSYRKDYGTYRNSWTWFEAGVRGLDPNNREDLDSITQDVVGLYTSRGQGSGASRVAKVSRYKYGAKKIVTNVHAGKEAQNHVVMWEADDEDEDVRKMVKEVRGGCRIEVSAHARYPGWTNHVRSVEIAIECAIVRR